MESALASISSATDAAVAPADCSGLLKWCNSTLRPGRSTEAELLLCAMVYSCLVDNDFSAEAIQQSHRARALFESLQCEGDDEAAIKACAELRAFLHAWSAEPEED